MKKFVFAALLPLLAVCCRQADNEDSLDKLVDSVYARLSLEEKVAQITAIEPAEITVDGKFSIEKFREIIPYGIGHICQYADRSDMSPDELRDMVKTVQLYASPASGQPLKPLQLKGFKRVTLAAGESAEVTFRISPEQLAWFDVDEDMWHLSTGDYVLRVGTSSNDLPLSASCSLTGKELKMAHKEVFFAE